MYKKIYKFLVNSPFDFLLIIPIYLLIIFINKKTFLSNKHKLFVINSSKFSDLKYIESLSNYSYYKFSTKLSLAILSPWFYNLDKDHQFDKYGDRVAFIKTKDSFFMDKRISIRKFHERVFIKVLKLLRVKAVLSPGIHYITDADLAKVCVEKKIPYVVFHKECLLITEKQREIAYDFISKILDYKASIIFCFNEATRNILLKCKNLEIGKVFAAPPTRLDYMNKKFEETKNKEKKKIIFFSFTPNHAVPGPMNIVDTKSDYNFDFKFKKIFFHSHLEFFKLAEKHPEEEFILKVKGRLKKFDPIKELEKKFNKPLPNNIEIFYEDTNSYDLMVKAKIVIGFNSTAVMESGLLNIPVIVPNYYEAADEFKNLTLFKNFREEFDIVDDPNNFLNTISNYIKDKKKYILSEEIKKKRIKIFEEYLTSREVNYLNDYEKHINKLISQE